jgi:5-methylcytosine-specific restriction endonuclease McrA
LAMSFVFVVDQERKPLTPVHSGRARFLLSTGHAAVLRRYPFTIILKEAKPDEAPQPLRVKLDPGSKTTGMAVVNDTTGQVVWAAEVTHRGVQITANLLTRRGQRRGRRQRHTRYRKPRFANRTRPKGWLPPSLCSRIDNILTWVARIQKWCPIGAISMELVKFDTQLMQNAEISGIEYQQGTLQGYEVREYLLEKWQRRCAYCGAILVPLQLEHITPKVRGGSNRISNLTLACVTCNQRKDNLTAEEFGYPDIQAQAKRPLRDVAAVNVTRWALYRRLQATGLPVESGTGGRTKWNRTQRKLPKTHWLDAACVGVSTPAMLQVQGIVPYIIQAMGRHSRQMQRTNASGFPDKAPKATSVVGGFRTGDMVRAVVPASSAKAGVYMGRLAIRATGVCNIKTANGTVQGIHIRYCRPLHRGDGYTYQQKGKVRTPYAAQAEATAPQL